MSSPPSRHLRALRLALERLALVRDILGDETSHGPQEFGNRVPDSLLAPQVLQAADDVARLAGDCDHGRGLDVLDVPPCPDPSCIRGTANDTVHVERQVGPDVVEERPGVTITRRGPVARVTFRRVQREDGSWTWAQAGRR